MEEYFRRKGTVRGVENLQLEVVKPDIDGALGDRGVRAVRAARGRPRGAGRQGRRLRRRRRRRAPDRHAALPGQRRRVRRQEGPGRAALRLGLRARGPGARRGRADPRRTRAGRSARSARPAPTACGRAEGGAHAANVLVVADAGSASAELGAGEAVATRLPEQGVRLHASTRVPPGPGGAAGAPSSCRRAAASYLPPRRSGRAGLRRSTRAARRSSRSPSTSSAFGTFAGSVPAGRSRRRSACGRSRSSVPHAGHLDGRVRGAGVPEAGVHARARARAGPSYLTGETVEAVARLAYAFGGPVADADVAYEVYPARPDLRAVGGRGLRAGTSRTIVGTSAAQGRSRTRHARRQGRAQDRRERRGRRRVRDGRPGRGRRVPSSSSRSRTSRAAGSSTRAGFPSRDATTWRS